MKKRNWIFLLVALMAISIFLVGCGSNDDVEQQEPADEVGGEPADEANDEANEEANEEGDTSEGEGEASGDTINIVLKADNWSFDQEEYVVPLGATVNVTIENVAGFHAAEIEGYDVEVTPNDPITFVADQAGEFTIACSIMCGSVEDHDNMVSTLVVQ